MSDSNQEICKKILHQFKTMVLLPRNFDGFCRIFRFALLERQEYASTVSTKNQNISGLFWWFTFGDGQIKNTFNEFFNSQNFHCLTSKASSSSKTGEFFQYHPPALQYCKSCLKHHPKSLGVFFVKIGNIFVNFPTLWMNIAFLLRQFPPKLHFSSSPR